MIDIFYDQVTVKTIYKGSHYGSGVLLQTENKLYSYLITAWHCLNQEKEADLNSIQLFHQITGEMKPLCIVPVEIMINEQNDIAIIKLESIHELPVYRMCTVSCEEPVMIVGFPKALDNQQSRVKRFPLGAKVISMPGNDFLTLSSVQPLDTLTQSARDVMSSFSGSGIFKVSAVSYTHLRAHETRHDVVCRLL